MARRTRFVAWMMAALMVSSIASAQSADGAATDAANNEADVSAVDAPDADASDADASGANAAADVGSTADEAEQKEAAEEATAATSNMEADYVAPEHSDAPTSPEMDAGISAYQAGDLRTASLKFYTVMMDEEPDSPLGQRAQFKLMQTLTDMGLLYGASLIVDDIVDSGEDGPYFQDSATTMIKIAQHLPGDSEVLGRVAQFKSLFPDRIPPDTRDEMAFLLGNYSYQAGHLDAAIDYFAAVSPQSPNYAKALFISAITHVRQYDAPGAAKNLKAIMRLVADSHGAKRKELTHISQLARLTMARMFYSTGEYQKSIKYYEEIGQDSPYWLDSLFESSWAYFQVDEYNHALGNLLSLNSPFFDDQYYPEAPILQAVIFFYNCEFDQVRLALDDFQYIYSPLKDELQITVDGFLNNEEAYDFLKKAQDNTGDNEDFDPRLQQIVQASLSDTTLSRAMDFVDELQKEADYIDEQPEAWSHSELGDFLYGQTIGELGLSKQSTGALVEKRLRAILDQLKKRSRESSAILVETDLAEADALSKSVEGELANTGKTDRDTRVHADSEHIVWKFEGEFWRDELGYYFYHITSQCQDAAANTNQSASE